MLDVIASATSPLSSSAPYDDWTIRTARGHTYSVASEGGWLPRDHGLSNPDVVSVEAACGKVLWSCGDELDLGNLRWSNPTTLGASWIAGTEYGTFVVRFDGAWRASLADGSWSWTPDDRQTFCLGPVDAQEACLAHHLRIIAATIDARLSPFAPRRR